MTTVWTAIGVGAAAIGLLGLLLVAAYYDAKDCADHGGHIITKSTTGVGIGMDGNVVPTFGSVSFCVTADGRIIR